MPHQNRSCTLQKHKISKTSIGFWCRRELNPKSLIQPSEILLVELTRTHKHLWKVWIRKNTRMYYKLGTKTNFPVIPTISWLKFCPNFEITGKTKYRFPKKINSPKQPNHNWTLCKGSSPPWVWVILAFELMKKSVNITWQQTSF